MTTINNKVAWEAGRYGGVRKKRSVCVDLVSIGSAFGQQDVFKLRFTQIVDPNRIKPQFGAH